MCEDRVHHPLMLGALSRLKKDESFRDTKMGGKGEKLQGTTRMRSGELCTLDSLRGEPARRTWPKFLKCVQSDNQCVYKTIVY